MHLDVPLADVHATDSGVPAALEARQVIEKLEPQLRNRSVVRANRPQRVLQDARCGRIAVEKHADIANAILHAITPVGSARWTDQSGAVRDASRRGLALPRSEEQT